MAKVYLNGDYVEAADAKISPMDRGFLFGDGIYEVIPSYDGQFVGFRPHLERLLSGLAAIEIEHSLDYDTVYGICHTLCQLNGLGNLGIYLQVSRGADVKRHHAYPSGIAPTVFAYAFEIPPIPTTDPNAAKTFHVASHQDLRWQRCHIKSTALLGNVMHYQHAHKNGKDETLLFNRHDELTEAASCNAFIVKNGEVFTPALDDQKLPGITRLILLDVLRKYSDITVHESVITREQVNNADEVWITSSTKQVGPVLSIDGVQVADGKIGPVWQVAQSLFAAHQFDYN